MDVKPWTDQEVDVEIRFAEHEMFQHNLWRRRNAATLRELLELRKEVERLRKADTMPKIIPATTDTTGRRTFTFPQNITITIPER